ncbi:MAG: phosphatase PAP2 family protein [Alphaproteobacteria bacterium]|jgi:membrane-associated phospholipid phosphatase|nr:phosphatase PAP2 family protein [Alphaproteobacteria bacterium]
MNNIYNVIYNFFGINKEIFIFVNKITNVGIIPTLLKISSQFFFIGNFAAYYLIICLYCYFKLKKRSNPKIEFVPIYNQLVKAGTCYSLFGFAYAALKFGINLPRPFCSLTPSEFTTILDVTKERCLSSFPSAHTGLTILIAYYLWPYLTKYQKAIVLSLIVVVSISRITLAMHYPADIIYSILIASLIIFFSNKLVDYMQNIIVKPIGKIIADVLFGR